MEGLEGQDKVFVPNTGVHWQPGKVYTERHHVAHVVAVVTYFGKRLVNRNEGG